MYIEICQDLVNLYTSNKYWHPDKKYSNHLTLDFAIITKLENGHAIITEVDWEDRTQYNSALAHILATPTNIHSIKYAGTVNLISTFPDTSFAFFARATIPWNVSNFFNRVPHPW